VIQPGLIPRTLCAVAFAPVHQQLGQEPLVEARSFRPPLLCQEKTQFIIHHSPGAQPFSLAKKRRPLIAEDRAGLAQTFSTEGIMGR